MIPQEFWGNPDNAKEWHKRARYYDTSKVEEFLLNEFKSIENKINSILEVGAGDGRFIGMFKEKHGKSIKYASLDINPELSKFVADKYKIKTYVGDLTKKLPLKRKQFDFVFTHQVIQHIPPDGIDRALFELGRLAKKELWLIEGYEMLDMGQGHMKHKGDGGTFSWRLDKLIDCYETKFVYKNNESGLMIYKIKL